MASAPPKLKPAMTSPESLEQRFRRLEAEWSAATGHLSSTTKIVQHPAYKEIVSMGKAVVPLMLRDLTERPRLWVWALPDILGEDPVAPDDRGDIAKMSDAWLEWGRKKGYRV
jgi:hypothetical protein